LDQLLEDFYSNKFNGFSSHITLADNILTTPVPIVELSLGLDTAYLLEIAKQIPLGSMNRKTYPYEIYPRFQGWHIQLLWSHNFKNTLISDIYYKKVDKPIEDKSADDLAKLIQGYLSTLGLNCKLCVLSMFESNGYVRPHRDIGLNETPLDYFWIPLNNPRGSQLRVYPYGTVEVTLGNMYLLNQEQFVHSAVNYSSESRYALIGHLTNISTKLKSLITDSIQSNYLTGNTVSCTINDK
jgi:hypothetical protein